MILTAFFNLLWLILYAITSPIRILGDATLSPDLNSNLATAGSYLNSITDFVPVGTVFTVLVLVLAIENYHFIWKIINWVRKLLPTQS